MLIAICATIYPHSWRGVEGAMVCDGTNDC